MIWFCIQYQKRAHGTRKMARNCEGCRERDFVFAMLRALCLISPNASHCDASTVHATPSMRAEVLDINSQDKPTSKYQIPGRLPVFFKSLITWLCIYLQPRHQNKVTQARLAVNCHSLMWNRASLTIPYYPARLLVSDTIKISHLRKPKSSGILNMRLKTAQDLSLPFC